MYASWLQATSLVKPNLVMLAPLFLIDFFPASRTRVRCDSGLVLT